MDYCLTCKAPIGEVQGRRQMGLFPGHPILCGKCGCIMRLGSALEPQLVPDSELEEFFKQFPGVKRTQVDVLSRDVTDGSECPGCKKRVANIYALGNEARPLPGAITVCDTCGALASYTYDMRLRLLTPEERTEVLARPDLPDEVRRLVLGAAGISTEKTACPRCLHPLTRVSTMDFTTPEAGPKTGDSAVCNYCGALLIFTGDSQIMRLATDTEEKAILEESPEVQTRIDQVLISASKGNEA